MGLGRLPPKAIVGEATLPCDVGVQVSEKTLWAVQGVLAAQASLGPRGSHPPSSANS